MPRLTRSLKDARKAKAEALKASEASTDGNNNDNTTTTTSNSAPCGTSSHLVSNGGEMRELTAGESKRENVTESNASEVVQGKRPEKCTAEIGKERSDGGEWWLGNIKHQKVNEVNAFTAVQEKRAEKSRAEIAKERSGGGVGGPSRKSAEEETISLRLWQLESKQNQREERSGFAGNKGFRQDFDGRNSSASQNYAGYNSRQGGQHGYYENQWSGRGGSNEGDSRRIDAIGRVFGERGDDDALLERPMSQVCISPLLPSSAGAQSHHEHGEPNGAAATMPTTTIPITLSETPTTLVDPDWQEGDPVGTQGWRDFVSNVITGMVTSMGTQRPVWASHGLQNSAGRHEDTFEPVAQLRAELEAQRGAVEERLHRENFELRVEVARLGGIIEGMKMMRNSRSHS